MYFDISYRQRIYLCSSCCCCYWLLLLPHWQQILCLNTLWTCHMIGVFKPKITNRLMMWNLISCGFNFQNVGTLRLFYWSEANFVEYSFGCYVTSLQKAYGAHVVCDGLVFPINSLVCELNLNKKDILGQFWDEVARLGLGSPVSVCLSARPAVMQPSLERQTENMQPLFWKARPAGMTAPKTASDGSEACGHEGHFDVSQQQPPKLEARVSLEHKIIWSPWSQ